jgi:hypothetical protein
MQEVTELKTQLVAQKGGARARVTRGAALSLKRHFIAQAPEISPSRREKDEGYADVVAVLNDRWRLIRGSCNLQWVVQRRKTALTWESVAFCATKEGVLLRIPKDGCYAEAMAAIRALPVRFPRSEGGSAPGRPPFFRFGAGGS